MVRPFRENDSGRRPDRATRAADTFCHEAVFYAGENAFVAATSEFLRQGFAADEAALVVVSEGKISALRDELGDEATRVHFADMAEVGVNPARIIPLWQRFLEQHLERGRAVRGIGEPVWAGRSSAELAECQRHERLLNLAFSGNADFWLLCPYDTESLDESVLAEARQSHPYLGADTGAASNCSYAGTPEPSSPHSEALRAPPADAVEMSFDGASIEATRRFVEKHSLLSGLAGRAGEFVLAVNEVVTNSVVHGGGSGVVGLWNEDGSLVCEVRDHGRIDLALAGRVAPPIDSEGGRGLWMANQLCDLVQLRSFPDGNVVRLHIRVAPTS